MDSKTSPLAALNDPGLLKSEGLINGEWVPGHANARFAVDDPATGQELVKVANLGAADAAAAISATQKAWPLWRAKTAKERAAIMLRWFRLLEQHADDLARIMTAEQGKPLAEARGEVAYGASFIEWFAEEARRDAFAKLAARELLLVDSEPRDLAATLVNRYHAVKRAGLL